MRNPFYGIDSVLRIAVRAAFFIGGIVVGVASALPKVKLFDLVPQFLGSLMGAAMSICGAAWLLLAQERQANRRNGVAIKAICSDWLKLVDKGILQRPQAGIESRPRIEHIIATLERFNSRWNSLAGEQIEVFVRIERALANLRSITDDMCRSGPNDTPRHVLVERAQVQTRKLRRLIGLISR